jgi:hypothetical protein
MQTASAAPSSSSSSAAITAPQQQQQQQQQLPAPTETHWQALYDFQSRSRAVQLPLPWGWGRTATSHAMKDHTYSRDALRGAWDERRDAVTDQQLRSRGADLAVPLHPSHAAQRAEERAKKDRVSTEPLLRPFSDVAADPALRTMM